MKSNLWQIDSPYGECILLSDNWKIINEDANSKVGKLVCERIISDEELKIFSGQIGFSFVTINSKVKFFINGKQYYSFAHNGKRYVGSESGDSVHFIRFPKTSEHFFKIRIELAAFEENYLKTPLLPEFYVGNMAALVNLHERNTFFDGFMSYSVIIVSLMGFFFTLAFYLSIKSFPKEYFFWSLFSFLCGIGFLFDSDFINLIISNSFILVFVPTIILSLTPVLFHLYIFMNKVLAYNKKVFVSYSVASLFVAFLVEVFAFMPNVPFSYVRIFVSLFIISYLFFVIAIQVNECFSYTGSFSVPAVICILLAIVILVDLTFSIIPPEKDVIFRFTKPFFCVVFFVQSIYIINDFFNIQVLTARKEMYDSAINTDLLTGTGTRPSFWKFRNVWEKRDDEWKKSFNLSLVEICNLSAINRTFGFEKGDLVLKGISEILKKNFATDTIYRFDGSSFAIISIDLEKLIIEKKLEKTLKDSAGLEIDDDMEIKINVVNSFSNPMEDLTFDAFVTRVGILRAQKRLSMQQ